MIIHLKTAFIKSKFVLSAILLIVTVYGFYPADVSAAGALQVNDNGKSIVVNTGAGLEYAINADNGDLTSAKLNGIKLTTSSGKGSHIKSGLGSSADVSWAMSSDGSSVIITTTEAEDDLTHYYISRSGENIIYMATYLGDGASFGEMRYIFRGNGAVLTNTSPNSNNGGSTGNVESQDVKGHANGYTTSKYYDNDQAMDLGIRGVTGDGVGVFMAYGNREKSSGGPFFRDIQFQSGGDTEIYNYMFSGHNQTESLRKGLHGPYAYIFTTGETPSTPDFSWMSELNLLGWEAERGKVVLNGLAGMNSSYSYTVGFSNSNAQYWMTTSAKGSAAKSNMIPGTYTMTVYKGELAVHEQNVNVLAGSTTALNTITIKNDPSSTSALWRIGDWDGTPLEFLNGQNISKFHPSDIRNQSWEPVHFEIDNAANEFPAIQFRGQNSLTTITFDMDATQSSFPHEFNIGITAASNGGRPSVTINGHELKNPPNSSQPKSRSFTIGTYRGNNATFNWTIPASYFVEGTNTISIKPISGNTDSGPWLSAGWAYDVVELLNE